MMLFKPRKPFIVWSKTVVSSYGLLEDATLNGSETGSSFRQSIGFYGDRLEFA
ncbi:MAG UNVERIFIED_CONTAM: hypothetical protein LVT10_00230 [Anaerolineae bacterium]